MKPKNKKRIFFLLPVACSLFPIPTIKLIQQTLIINICLSLRLLLDGNMVDRGWNEADVLPLARHYLDPTWVAQDWYLNQTAGYRSLFLIIVGYLVIKFGFLATSIIGRFFCYSLFSIGLTLLGKKLGISFPFLLLVALLWADLGWNQGMIANEWMIGGLEAKAVAYSLILIAISLMLAKHYRTMFILLGLATSFHVLVGAWAFLTVCGWLLLQKNFRSLPYKEIILLLLLYFIFSIIAIPAILQQILTPTPASAISPSYIYVFLRLSHHLNPLSWTSGLWIEPLVYFLIFIFSLKVLKNQIKTSEKSEIDLSRFGLAQFAIISLIPFLIGLIIAPFDDQGQFLQYYPFRFGDVILPLTTYLLAACAIENSLLKWPKKRIQSILFLILLSFISLQTVDFYQQCLSLKNFPAKPQKIDSNWQEMSAWIREQTPQDAMIISAPVELANFTWLTERSTVAKFKLFPQTKAKILEAYQRWDDLSGNQLLSNYIKSGHVSKEKTMELLTTGFKQLNTAQAQALMIKYGANYFLTTVEHHLDLDIVHCYEPYILYQLTMDN